MKRYFKAIIAITLCCCLFGCGNKEGSNDKKANEAKKTVTEENDTYLVDYGDVVMYQSSTCKISLRSIEIGYGGLAHFTNAPYDAVEVSLLVENLINEHIYYEKYSININGFKIGTSSNGVKINLDGNEKEIETFTVYKEKFEEARIKQIDSIKLVDDYLNIGSVNNEKISNAEVKLEKPYEIHFE